MTVGKPRVPSYRFHKPRGQAVITLDGRDVYLGKHGTPESREAYDRVVAEWLAAGRRSPEANNGSDESITVVEVLTAYLKWASTYYFRDGKPTKELTNVKEAMRPIRRLCGRTPACDFGPRALKTVRQSMIDRGWARTHINHQVQRVRRIFKWATAEELVPAHVYHSLQAVSGLRYGTHGVRESEPVKPVPEAWVDATIQHVAPPVAAMIGLQRLTAMRPGEVAVMRGCDIDMSGPVWIFAPPEHKTRWRGRDRKIPPGAPGTRDCPSVLETGYDRVPVLAG